ncbi:DUF6624 domain-containing protein [Spirosoma soli]|uniref:DUF6624 domain-containing protein n=1 Tax=Spirosoma soli TaxID=1770529 RepID=A0ABW5M9F6_9BACT
MRNLLAVVAISLIIQPCFGQTTYAVQDTAYVHAVELALDNLKKGNCQPCLDVYKKAFSISQKSALSTLRAAVCAYQCGQSQQARAYLEKAISLDWWSCEDMWKNRKGYPEFDPLRVSLLAVDFQKDIDKQKIAAGRNPTLERELETIYETDQRPRLKMDTVGKLEGFKSPRVALLLEEMRQADSVNLLKIEQIIQQYGYPGKQLVGDQLSVTAWLVIQHAPLPIQEKYLPLMQKAADKGDLSKGNIALLVDRIRLRNGLKQLYGSQIHTHSDGKPDGFHPIEDEINVNKRRAEVGLEPIEDYARRFGFEYKPPTSK